MRAYDLLCLMAEPLKRMSKVGIRTSDYKYIGLFQEYSELSAKGEKKEYIKASLSRRYGVSESTLIRIVKRFSQQLNVEPEKGFTHAPGRLEIL